MLLLFFKSCLLFTVERSLDASSIFPEETITYAGRYATLICFYH